MKILLIIIPAASIICGIATGRLPEVSAAVLDGAAPRSPLPFPCAE